MGLDLQRLLGVTLYRGFDTDKDGRILAGSDESGSTQLTEISPAGEVTTLTALPGPCTGRYLAGERAVIVSHDDGGNERHQLSVLPLSGTRPAGPGDLQPLVRDPRYIHLLADVAPGRVCYFTNRRNGVAFDPVVRDLATGSERTIALGDHSYAEAALSPDGRRLALSVSSPVTAASAHVLVVDLAGEPGSEQVTEVTQPDAPAMNGQLCWYPDSSALIFTSNSGREFTAIARYTLATGQRDWIVTDDSADLAGSLSPDGTLLLVERNDDGASVLALHDGLTGAWLRAVALPASGCTIYDGPLPPPRWSPDSATVTFSVTGAQLPGDVLTADTSSGTVRRVTRSADSLGGLAAAVPERHRVPAPDGEQVPCLVYRGAQPADPALAGSAVLVVHGGPEAQARQNFNPYVQALAAAGHTVLVPNVRGSVGYGKRWYSMDDVERRLDSVADLAALHAYLPRLGLDPARAALWGGSYGGYMVLAGLAFQPELWAAGVDIVGISSLVSFLENTSAYRRAYREREYGTLARDREFLASASPLTRIDQVQAPLFIIHGANDPRVPLSEAEQIHSALTGRGQECELVVYADEGHGLARRHNREDAVPKALAFLARHLAG
ncbi:MAG TPA: alpha/beta fold hydrolase [Streptosporangiaceae bacterium]|nr:alpha/beta fold hydrolase [Streptosporangiaceae bacterium]